MISRLNIPPFPLGVCAWLLLTGFVCVGTCHADELTKEQVAWFETNIRPLLAEKCYSCHSIKEAESEGGLTLDTKSGWQKGGDNGPALVPKDVDASLLIRAIRYQDPDLQMPPDKKLTDRQIKMLEQWVLAGAPDPRGDAVAAKKSYDPADPEHGKSHWAFTPLRSPNPPPKISDPNNWAETPIDRFVLKKLVDKGLEPNQTADRRTLATRVFLLLTGLPPTSEQLDQFVKDESDDAYEQLVDQLIASPQFGEVWGRHWLDLARYADSNGLDENFLFREAWRYRNWVINAVNVDQPFDEFTTEQVAGDLLPFNSIEERDRQRIGAGFLVIGPKVLLGVNGELQKMDVADELIQTVGTTFLAQTLGCARCHDHKFDPFPTEDYYSLAGIFTSTEVMQMRYMLGEQRKMERLFGLGPDEDTVNSAYEKYWRERGSLKGSLDQAKNALADLKKKDSDLAQLLNKYAAALSQEAKAKLEALIQAGTKKIAEPESDECKSIIDLQQKHVAELESRYSKPPPIPPRAMIPVDKKQVADESIRIAGQFNKKGKTVPRGFLRVLSNGAFSIPKQGSGRMELADWLTDVDKGAGQLTARVLANRIWHHLIGQGIVKTTDNFGRTGETPSHPELLDYLASELIRSNWSVKSVVRTIVLSSTFRQSSQHNKAGNDLDPENRLAWRANRRRLSPEAYRDRMLFVANKLDLRPLDSTVNYLGDQATAVGANTNRRRTDFPNRSIYLPVIRNDLPEIFEAFDFADTHRPTGSRPTTTVATTGLYILNDPLMMSTSRSVASRILAEPGLTDSERIQSMFSIILGASSTEYEQEQIKDFVAATETLALKELQSQKKNENSDNKKKETQSDKSDANSRKEARLRAWASACHAIFASSRFQIME